MLATAAAVLWKDLKIEMRTRDAVSAAFVFAILVLVVFNFALGGDTPEMRRLAAGFFWVAFAFSGTLALNRSSAIEKEGGRGPRPRAGTGGRRGHLPRQVFRQRAFS